MLLEQEIRKATELSRREQAVDMAMGLMVSGAQANIEEGMRR